MGKAWSLIHHVNDIRWTQGGHKVDTGSCVQALEHSSGLPDTSVVELDW